MYIYLLIIFVLLSVIAYLNSRTNTVRLKPKKEYHFGKKEKVMTEAESRFFDTLTQSVGERFFILPQAHLSTFIDHKIKGQNWKAAFSVINGKSVDFLLVEKDSLRPAAAIELDDWSHKREDRIVRDDRVQSILQEADVLLVRFNDPNTDKQTIIDTFQKAVSQSSEIR